ncbi:hypothetical protein T45_06883 [Streptomyces turgidiscabies]|nr:hypothetical protein T45_06883 [Streptomyces turgidiscabies]
MCPATSPAGFCQASRRSTMPTPATICGEAGSSMNADVSPGDDSEDRAATGPRGCRGSRRHVVSVGSMDVARAATTGPCQAEYSGLGSTRPLPRDSPAPGRPRQGCVTPLAAEGATFPPRPAQPGTGGRRLGHVEKRAEFGEVRDRRGRPRRGRHRAVRPGSPSRACRGPGRSARCGAGWLRRGHQSRRRAGGDRRARPSLNRRSSRSSAVDRGRRFNVMALETTCGCRGTRIARLSFGNAARATLTVSTGISPDPFGCIDIRPHPIRQRRPSRPQPGLEGRPHT